jgi:hypothetical protein
MIVSVQKPWPSRQRARLVGRVVTLVAGNSPPRIRRKTLPTAARGNLATSGAIRRSSDGLDCRLARLTPAWWERLLARILPLQRLLLKKRVGNFRRKGANSVNRN